MVSAGVEGAGLCDARTMRRVCSVRFVGSVVCSGWFVSSAWPIVAGCDRFEFVGGVANVVAEGCGDFVRDLWDWRIKLMRRWRCSRARTLETSVAETIRRSRVRFAT